MGHIQGAGAWEPVLVLRVGGESVDSTHRFLVFPRVPSFLFITWAFSSVRQFLLMLLIYACAPGFPLSSLHSFGILIFPL